MSKVQLQYYSSNTLNNQQNGFPSSNLITIIDENKKFIPQEMICRICLFNDLNLISLCKCKGSLQFVHEDCMKQWLVYQIHKKNASYGNIQVIQYHQCELCKQNIGFFSTEKRYCSRKAFLMRIRNQKFALCLHIFAIQFFLAGIIIFLIALLGTIGNGYSCLEIGVIVMFLIFQLFLTIGFITLLYHCINQNFIAREIRIKQLVKRVDPDLDLDILLLE